MPTIVMPIIAKMPTPMERISIIEFRMVKTPQPSPSSFILPKKVVSTTLSTAKAWVEKIVAARRSKAKNRKRLECMSLL